MSTASSATLIGVAVSVAGNVVISLALNCQKLAHHRIAERQEEQEEEGIVGEEREENCDEADASSITPQPGRRGWGSTIYEDADDVRGSDHPSLVDDEGRLDDECREGDIDHWDEQNGQTGRDDDRDQDSGSCPAWKRRRGYSAASSTSSFASHTSVVSSGSASVSRSGAPSPLLPELELDVVPETALDTLTPRATAFEVPGSSYSPDSSVPKLAVNTATTELQVAEDSVPFPPSSTSSSPARSPPPPLPSDRGSNDPRSPPPMVRSITAEPAEVNRLIQRAREASEAEAMGSPGDTDETVGLTVRREGHDLVGVVAHGVGEEDDGRSGTSSSDVTARARSGDEEERDGHAPLSTPGPTMVVSTPPLSSTISSKSNRRRSSSQPDPYNRKDSLPDTYRTFSQSSQRRKASLLSPSRSRRSASESSAKNGRGGPGDMDWENGGGGSDGPALYLRSRLWWTGLCLMAVGEAGNFLSYGFAPASLVAPLGAVALLSNCIISPLLLGERFRKRDIFGMMLAIIGSVTVVFSSRSQDKRLSTKALIRAITQTVFLIYAAVSAFLAAVLAFLSEREAGDRWILVDVGLCAVFGGFTVLSTKGISSVLNYSFVGALREWITYPIVLVLVSTAIMQIKYLNRALQRFDSREVIPTQFCLFTLSAIIGSAILYRDFEDLETHRLLNFFFGVCTIFSGVFLLTRNVGLGQEIAEEGDEEMGLAPDGHRHRVEGDVEEEQEDTHGERRADEDGGRQQAKLGRVNGLKRKAKATSSRSRHTSSSSTTTPQMAILTPVGVPALSVSSSAPLRRAAPPAGSVRIRVSGSGTGSRPSPRASRSSSSLPNAFLRMSLSSIPGEITPLLRNRSSTSSDLGLTGSGLVNRIMSQSSVVGVGTRPRRIHAGTTSAELGGASAAGTAATAMAIPTGLSPGHYLLISASSGASASGSPSLASSPKRGGAAGVAVGGKIGREGTGPARLDSKSTSLSQPQPWAGERPRASSATGTGAQSHAQGGLAGRASSSKLKHSIEPGSSSSEPRADGAAADDGGRGDPSQAGRGGRVGDEANDNNRPSESDAGARERREGGEDDSERRGWTTSAPSPPR